MNNWLAWSLLSALFCGSFFTWMIASFSIVGFGPRSFLALLFSRVATGRSLTRCAHGQTKCPFRNSLRCRCPSRNTNVASLAWRRTCADRRGHPGLQMKAAGCKSDESNQFAQLEIWNPRPGSSIRIGGYTWLCSRTRFRLSRRSKDRRASK